MLRVTGKVFISREKFLFDVRREMYVLTIDCGDSSSFFNKSTSELEVTFLSVK